MSRELHVHLLPTLVEPAALDGGVAVVIDVLRASTTIIQALAENANCVIPFASVDEARRFSEENDEEEIVLGGERDGIKIEGFDLGNSPLEYAGAVVGGKSIAFTTTNGTKALAHSSNAERIVVAGFTNINVIIGWLLEQDQPIHIVCAGTDGEITVEDCLCAGAICTGLATQDQFDWDTWKVTDTVPMVISSYAVLGFSLLSYHEILCRSRGGSNLMKLGFEADIEFASRWDEAGIVPEYFPKTGRIEIAKDAPTAEITYVQPPREDEPEADEE